jgi:cell division protein FtsN
MYGGGVYTLVLRDEGGTQQCFLQLFSLPCDEGNPPKETVDHAGLSTPASPLQGVPSAPFEEDPAAKLANETRTLEAQMQRDRKAREAQLERERWDEEADRKKKQKERESAREADMAGEGARQGAQDFQVAMK